ncbi:MAG: acyltransferase domain-containing protein [Acidimicrobiia bacterium]|nr:acyltransferase domain-containing protein [Acidimicrobiia bacterium]MYB24054.1 acyltransferase domain-containing protein [Acidimicrobiia bacterium]
MGAAWRSEPSWELVEEASDATGRDVAALLVEADAEELRQTRNSQLATFVMSMLALDAVARVGLLPNAHAGHSLGEYSALVASGILDFAEAAHLVAERGEAMQLASEEQDGTMAAVLGLADSDVEECCDEAGSNVWVANYNAPGQVVIAGAPADVDAAADLARRRGAKRVMKLQVGGAFHTPFMAPAYERLTKALATAEFHAPDAPVYANVDAAPYDNAGVWPRLLARQLTSPVRWHQTIRRLLDAGCRTFVELGPGSALTGMAKRIERGLETLSLRSPADIDPLLESIGAGGDSDAPLAEGESLHAHERLVVATAAGVFKPAEPDCRGTRIAAGAVLGEVSGEPVRSPFSGTVMDYLAVAGERVATNQPIAWLRTE